jgi:hypothetical protein
MSQELKGMPLSAKLTLPLVAALALNASQMNTPQSEAKVRETRRAGWRLSEDDYRNILDYLERL